MTLNSNKFSGFTVIEVVIVVSIIAIIASIIFVSYGAIQTNTRDKSILSDLDALDGLETEYAIENNVIGKAWYSGNGIDSSLDFTPSGTGSEGTNVIDIVIDSIDYCIRGYNLKSHYDSISNSLFKESSDGACSRISASSEAVADSP